MAEVGAVRRRVKGGDGWRSAGHAAMLTKGPNALLGTRKGGGGSLADDASGEEEGPNACGFWRASDEWIR